MNKIIITIILMLLGITILGCIDSKQSYQSMQQAQDNIQNRYNISSDLSQSYTLLPTGEKLYQSSTVKQDIDTQQ